ncbi:zinc ribbon domain-containing protein [Candidatus Bathyarchaeota archaeon]|nr:zinc ribbon domain-containing protein [Candidatus Bathyarchaeota archaeon]
MRKKGLVIWIMSTLTVITLIHLIDSVNAFLFNNPTQLLQIYPILNTFLTQMSTQIYFYLSAATSAILWGITCIIAFDNPVELFLNKILSDAKQQSLDEAKVMDGKGELFDLMYEKMESDSETLSHVKDLIRNVRSEVREIAPIKVSMEKTRRDLSKITKQLITLEEKVFYPLVCHSCSHPVRADFKLCPYCGIALQLTEITISQ